ncbi:MAG: hypothetical protein L0387_07900 [Acidobacteria bacterium]|nr:hypothetical protein [Acidobacteriota bacterium]MCI0718143.1 hypothetical protein [Acidobacteriota bacterium]
MAKENDKSTDRPVRDRREFLKRTGKTLAYSVPVIVSLQSKRLNAQQMSCSSCSSPDIAAEAPV